MSEPFVTTILTEIFKKMVGIFSDRLTKPAKSSDSTLPHLIDLHEQLRSVEVQITQLIEFFRNLEKGNQTRGAAHRQLYPILHSTRRSLRAAFQAVQHLNPVLSIMADDDLQEIVGDFLGEDERDAMDFLEGLDAEALDYLADGNRLPARGVGGWPWSQGVVPSPSIGDLVERLEALKTQGSRVRRSVAEFLRKVYAWNDVRAYIEKRDGSA